MPVPLATYRLQLNAAFGFDRARAVLDYLAALGVSHVYAAPIFAARHGSTHGYDVIAPDRLNDELGGAGAFNELIAALRAHDLGWIQDIVPNHMAFDSANGMLMDVLENGPASPYYRHFDINWEHPYESFRGRVLAPFLGKFYGEALESGELRLGYTQDGLRVNYYQLSFPVSIEAYGKFFAHRLPLLKRKLGPKQPDTIKYLGILYALRNLPSADENPERREQVEFAKQMLWELYSGNSAIHDFVEDNLRLFNGEEGQPDSFNLLDDLLAEQHFRLSFWKVATEEINYRRFFSINGLISLRMEDEAVFRDTHALILRLCRDGIFNGLRIDHIDGLYDPAAYLERLRAAAGEIYLVVEKILQPDEELPSWPVEGTSGYDFLSRVNGLFCERKHDRRFEKIYTRFIGHLQSWEALATATRRRILRMQMTGDVDRLARLLKDVSSRDRYARDITLLALRRALIEIMVCFPVYRTYVSDATYSEQDRAFMQRALRGARASNPELELELAFIEKFLMLDVRESMTADERADWVRFVMLFQQLTGPLMAKSIEDTAFYIHHKLLSLCEVGSQPGRFGTSAIEFHQFQKRRAGNWPHAMNATATHDTKRGEDMRARINVLSEMPERWEQRVNAWRKLNRAAKRHRAGEEIPDANDEYFYYQTLLGAWPASEDELPAFTQRLREYCVKAVREAAVHTAWLKPDAEYEQGFLAFLDTTLAPAPENHFLTDFLPFQREIARYGALNSLSQTLLKLTCPGVPDVYQGSELWDLSLVDPDNRRPVDFELRARILADIRTREAHDLPGLLHELLETRLDGRLKLFVLYRTLQTRRRHAALFTDGDYLPLAVQGRHRNHLLAFARAREGDMAVILAPRRCVPLAPAAAPPLGEAVWEDTRVILPPTAPARWRHAFTDQPFDAPRELSVAMVCERFPLGLLLAESAS